MNGRVLIVDDDISTLSMIQIMLESQDYQVTVAYDGQQALEVIQSEDFDLIITDLKMPRMNGIELLKEVKANYPEIEVIITTAYMTIETAISAMKMGAYDYLTKPIENLGRARAVIEKAVEKARIQTENIKLRSQLTQSVTSYHNIIGKSKPMQKVYEMIEKVAPSDTSILIQGESGTGKELVARAIHEQSLRADKCLVPVDCGSMPGDLLESELFGHKKGAFTGAVNEKIGLFEEADGGTLFLDEISSTDINFQVKLLRALQQKEIRRVGDTKPIKTDIRLIAASNKNIKEEVKKGNFRQDVFYRINIVTIDLPSLRERKEDLPLLCDHFLKKFSKKTGKNVHSINDEVLQTFLQYSWPGNVRELENIIERAMILTNSEEITKYDLPAEIIDESFAVSLLSSNNLNFNDAKQLFEKNYILQLLQDSNGNISAAAKKSGILRQSLQRKIRQYNIDTAVFK